jgi:hypothetical protein
MNICRSSTADTLGKLFGGVNWIRNTLALHEPNTRRLTQDSYTPARTLR